MKIIDSLQPEDAVYGLSIRQNNKGIYELVCDCKQKDHINDHGPSYHYDRVISLSFGPTELETLKSVLGKYRKAI